MLTHCLSSRLHCAGMEVEEGKWCCSVCCMNYGHSYKCLWTVNRNAPTMVVER